MKLSHKLGLTALTLAGALSLGTVAFADPFDGGRGYAPQVEQAAWVCGPWGCRWHHPHHHGWGYGRAYGPYAAYGWHGERCWWRQTPWGPRRVCREW